MNYVYIDEHGTYQVAKKFPEGFTVVYHNEDYEECVTMSIKLHALDMQNQDDVSCFEEKRLQTKRETIRMMASTIYGHLHGDDFKGPMVEQDLISEAIETASIIWREVEKRIT